MSTPQLAYRFGLRKLRYFHNQEDALRYAATLGPQHVMLKWGAYIFGVLPSYDYIEALFDGGAHLAPPFFGVERPDVPMYQTLVDVDKPQVPYIDIEWYEDDGAGTLTSEEEARTRLKRIIDLYATFSEDRQDHECDIQPFNTSCHRHTGKPWDPVAETGGYKFSFHVTLRCSGNCHLRNFDALHSLMHQFLAYINRPEIKSMPRYAWMWYGPDQSTCVIDTGVYTRRRAMRMPRCAKTPGGTTLRYDPLPEGTCYHVPEALHNRTVYHMHGYIADGPPIDVIDNDDLVPTNNPRPIHRAPLPPGEVDPLERLLQHVTDQLKRADLRFRQPGMIYQTTDTTYEAVVTNIVHRPLSAPNAAVLANYSNWFRVCCIINRIISDRDRALETWNAFTAQVPKRRNMVAFFDGVRNHHALSTRRRDNDADMQFLADRWGITDDWRALMPPVVHDTRCIVTPSARHDHQQYHVDPRQYALNGGVMLVCNQCRSRRFFGYPHEVGSELVDIRYISEHPPLLASLNRVIRSCHMDNATKTDMLLISNMGTGKTHILKCLRALDPSVKLVVLCMRQIFSYNIHKRLEPDIQGLRHYIKNHGDLGNRVVIQIDSLPKLVESRDDGSTQARRYDIVILEEVESLLAYMSSSTLAPKRQLIWSFFYYIINHAKLVLCMDADIGPRTHDILSYLRPGVRKQYIRNLACPLKRHHDIYGDEILWHERLYQALIAGRKMYIVTNDKTRLLSIHRKITSLVAAGTLAADFMDRVLFYTSDTPQSEKRAAEDCNTLWTTKNVVGFTPVIGCGVDFNPPDYPGGYFDDCFTYANDQSSPGRDVHQQIGRCRVLRPGGQVHTCIHHETVRTNITAHTVEDCRDYVISVVDAAKQRSEPAFAMRRVDLETGAVDIDMKDPLVRTLLHNMLERYQGLRAWMAVYNAYAFMHGDTTAYIPRVQDRPESTLVPPGEINRMMAEASEEQDQRLATAVRPTDAAVAVVDNQTGDRSVSPHALRKDQICSLLRVRDITSPEIWRVLRHRDFTMQLMVFMLVLHSERASAVSAVTSLVFDDAAHTEFSREIRDVVDYARNLHQYTSHRATYTDIHGRCDTVRACIEHVFGDMTETAGNCEHTVQLVLQMNDGAVQRTLMTHHPARVNWTAVNNSKTAKSAITAMLSLAGLRTSPVPFTSRIRICPDRLNIMANLAALVSPDEFQRLVTRQLPEIVRDA